MGRGALKGAPGGNGSAKEGYVGIDIARIVAAFLVVAIHTSPLSSFSETGDFVLTRVVARLAVPFFFMTSGFFLLSAKKRSVEAVRSFAKRTLAIYGAAILLYIPVNLYNGYFAMENFLPKLIKDLVFDGTLYHLWYLPASVIGAVIAWRLIERGGYRWAFAVSGVLYLIALFGDSYYGIAEKLPFLHALYALLFQIMDYTRNGFFFAPLFFVMGAYIADNGGIRSRGKTLYLCGFAGSMALMCTEALLLRSQKLQRHDSMYLFLVPAMYLLFCLLIGQRGRRCAKIRNVSLLIYVIHPMVILVVRMFARGTHTQAWLVENSLLHYICVCAGSAVMAVVLDAVWNQLCPKPKKENTATDRAYLEINLDNLAHNIRTIRAALPAKCEIMAVVKAQAYGHGGYEIAACCNRMGVHAFATATIDEAIELRRRGITGEILILGYTEPDRAELLQKYDLTQTLISAAYAMALEQQKCRVKAHIKIDTGMHRLGYDAGDTAAVIATFALHHIRLTGMFTHLCASDSSSPSDVAFSQMQIERFYQVVNAVKQQGIPLPKLHIQSSYGILNYPDLQCDYARIGILLYGTHSVPGTKTVCELPLRPVLSLKSKIILIRKVKKGESVGYNRTFVAESDRTIAVVPIGYADGYPRNLSQNNGYVLVNGQRAPIIGRICMDQMIIDITEVTGVSVCDTVTLIGTDKEEEITAAALAERADSIANELLSRMGSRLKIIYEDLHSSSMV